MRSGTFHEQHPVTLTDIEVEDRAIEAAKLATSIETHKARAKVEKKALNDAEKKLVERLYELGHAVRDKTEQRQVACVEQANLGTNMAETIRLDTHKVVGSRPLTADELKAATQVGFGFDGGDKEPN